MAITFVSFDDCFDGEVTPVLEAVYKLIKEYNLPIAPVSSDDGQGGFIVRYGEFDHVYSAGKLIDLIALLDDASITEISFEDLYDYPWNEREALHDHIIGTSFPQEEADDLLDCTGNHCNPLFDTSNIIDIFEDGFFTISMADNRKQVVVSEYNGWKNPYSQTTNHYPVTLNLGDDKMWHLASLISNYTSPVEHYELPKGSSWSAIVKFILKDSWEVGSKFHGSLQDQYTFLQRMQFVVATNPPYPSKDQAIYIKAHKVLNGLVASGDMTEKEMLESLHFRLVKLYEASSYHPKVWVEGLNYLWRS